MFSVRCQTPSADAEEIHPKWWGDGGKGWVWEEGEAKRREKSTKVVFSGYISVCPGVRNSRGPPVMAHIWVWGRGCFLTEEMTVPRMAGSQNDGLQPRLLTMQQGLCADLDGPEDTDTPQQTHDPALAELCPSGVSRDCLCSSPWPRPASSRTTLLFGRVEGASGGWGWGQSPVSPFLGPLLSLALSPRAQLCLPQEAPVSE